MERGLESGSVLAERYQLERLVGEGGMGSVWAAHHVVTLKNVAVKILRGHIGDDPQARRRFTNEARAAASIDHPNVIEVMDAFVLDEKTPVIVMELLEGESLRERLERQEVVPLAELGTILRPVLSALGAAHDRGIVHRDLKPDNVFLARKHDAMHPVVLDFGLAKLFAESTGTLRTLPGSRLGTPHYMAPEQARGGEVDYRVDIWALGVIIYECLSGVRPVEGANAGQVLERLVTGAIVPLEALEPDLPTRITGLVARMLARDVTERAQLSDVVHAFAPADHKSWSTAGALQPSAAAGANAASAPVVAKTQPQPAAFVPSVAGPLAPSVAGPLPASRSKSVWRPVLLVVVALGVMVGVFVGIWKVLAPQPSAANEDPRATANSAEAAATVVPLPLALGRPRFSQDGFWIWHNPRGRWFVRAIGRAGKHRFEGTLSGALVDAQTIDVEADDRFRRDGNTWKFSFEPDDRGDGVTFMVPRRECVHFDLKVDGEAQPQKIFLGRQAKHPGAAQFSVCPP